MRKHRGLRARNARKAAISRLLDGDVAYCFLKTGQSKVIYPTIELAKEAARRLNKMPSSHHPGEPYECDAAPHWHLRSARPETDDESEKSQ